MEQLMSIVHQIEIGAPVEVVFSLYEEVEAWPSWDSETTAVNLPGLTRDAQGWLKPRNGPKASIRVIDVIPNRSFIIEGKLPFCRMQFGHELKANATWTTATHWVRFVGPLAFVFRRLIGNGIDKTLPHTLEGLKRASEAKVR